MQGRPAAAFLTILLGLFLFSFFEYFFHRLLFHGSLRWMVEGHRVHHENPLGYNGIPFFLPSPLLRLLGLFAVLIPASNALLLAGSIAFGCVTYGLSHFIIHHTLFAGGWSNVWQPIITSTTTALTPTLEWLRRCGTFC